MAAQLWKDRRGKGVILAIALALLFVLISLVFLSVLEGPAWYLFSSGLRIACGLLILHLAPRLFGRSPRTVLRPKNNKSALIAGTGFLLYFLFFLFALSVGMEALEGLTLGLFLTRVLLQQLATGFYEELHYRFLICEGYFHGAPTGKRRLLYAFLSFALFGGLHLVGDCTLERFLTTGAIGFAFAAMFLCSRNVLIPMVLHGVYDIPANLSSFVRWNQSALFETVSSLFELALVVMFVLSLAMLLRHRPLGEEGWEET